MVLCEENFSVRIFVCMSRTKVNFSLSRIVCLIEKNRAMRMCDSTKEARSNLVPGKPVLYEMVAATAPSC